MPMPAQVERGEGYLAIDSSFRIAIEQYSGPILYSAALRLAKNLSAKTNIPLPLETVEPGKAATLHVHCEGRDPNSSPRRRTNRTRSR